MNKIRRGGVKLFALGLVCFALLAVAVAGCSPQPAATVTSANAGNSTQDSAAASEIDPDDGFAWTSDAECSSCHDAEAASMQDASCIGFFHESISCGTCHNDEQGLKEAHESCYTPLASLQQFTSVSSDTCLTCHDKEVLVSATANATALTDANGTVVNPHDPPASEDHDTLQCGNCHNMHDGDVVSADGAAALACQSCHHKNVYECGTCH